jgi:hypothetical protein
MNHLQIYSQPRPMRYMFFVDAAIHYRDLLDLIKKNLTYWGGTQNPIIPVKDGKISDAYRDLITRFDPDVIYHSATVDVQMIKDWRIFNPIAYVNLDEKPLKKEIEGVSRLHLLSLLEKQPLIYAKNIWGTESPLLNYYELNFGIQPVSYAGDEKAMAGHRVISITVASFYTLHSQIHTTKPIDYARLADIHIGVKKLRSLQNFQYDTTELVIAAGTDNTSDLLYWWNRHLYEGKKTFIVTKGELALLVSDGYFGHVLADNCEGQIINVLSFSLSPKEVEDIIQNSLKPLRSGKLFRYTPVDSFPYALDEEERFIPDIDQELLLSQSLPAGESHFKVVAPAFIKNGLMRTDTWAVDLRILTIYDSGGVSEIMLPKTANLSFFLNNVKARVNLSRRATYYYGSNSPLLPAIVESFQTPTFSSILSQLISSPVIDGEMIPTDYQHVELHDPSSRLLAFLGLFNNDFHALKEYLSDKFWYDLMVDACNTGKMGGDAITFRDLCKRCQYLMVRQKIAFGPRKKTWRNFENLELGLKPFIADLVSKKVLMPGYTLKCKHCGFKAWYAIEDVSTSVKCSGCMEHFALPVDPDISYRLSTLVKLNFFSAPKQPDGNAAVIGALVKIATGDNGHFDFSGQLNLYDDYRATKPVTDLDIVVLENGRFGIGEAKNNSAEFMNNKKKCLHQLYEVACNVRPDVVILCCVIDEKNNLKKARTILENLFKAGNKPMPDILDFKVSERTYFNFKGGNYFRY